MSSDRSNASDNSGQGNGTDEGSQNRGTGHASEEFNRFNRAHHNIPERRNPAPDNNNRVQKLHEQLDNTKDTRNKQISVIASILKRHRLRDYKPDDSDCSDGLLFEQHPKRPKTEIHGTASTGIFEYYTDPQTNSPGPNSAVSSTSDVGLKISRVDFAERPSVHSLKSIDSEASSFKSYISADKGPMV